MRRFGVTTSRQKSSASGMTLIEVTIATVIMTTALLALLVLAGTAMNSNSRNRWDTGATMTADMVMEQIASKSAYVATNIGVVDCNGQTFTINTASAAGTGAGAPLDTSGRIDFSQATVTGYSMRYAVCDPDGGQTRYDVRWNIRRITDSSGNPTFTNAVTVAARVVGATNQLNRFAIPVNLRRIVGP